MLHIPFLHSSPSPKLSPQQERNLLLCFRAGDRTASRLLLEAHHPPIRTLATRHRCANNTDADRFQAGCVGFLEALDNYQPVRAVHARLWTYAHDRVYYRIQELNTKDKYLSETARKNLARVLQTAEKISQEQGRFASVEQVAQRVGLNRRTVEEILLPREPLELVDDQEESEELLRHQVVLPAPQPPLGVSIETFDAVQSVLGKDAALKFWVLFNLQDYRWNEIAELVINARVDASRLPDLPWAWSDIVRAFGRGHPALSKDRIKSENALKTWYHRQLATLGHSEVFLTCAKPKPDRF